MGGGGGGGGLKTYARLHWKSNNFLFQRISHPLLQPEIIYKGIGNGPT